MTPDPSRFVLVGTSHAGNVGAAARAIKVMGFSELVLVAPRWADVLQRDEAIAMASGATDVLEGARVVATLGEALDGVSWVGATAMTPRDFGPPTFAPREVFGELAAGGRKVAFVFGSERFGLSNDDLYTCHANLAQAVQLLAYDWRQALGGYPVEARADAGVLADAVAVRGLVAHWQQALTATGFLDPAAPRKLVSRLHRLANRAALTVEEVQILRGIARAMEERSR
jgi:tRNA/rRNA methyltransferase